MAKLPPHMSFDAIEIGGMIAEGRAEDAMYQIVSILQAGKADAGTQKLAAKWIETLGIKAGDAKALRGSAPALPKEWRAIIDMVESLTPQKTKSEAVQAAADHFGYSDRHVYNCIDWYEQATIDSNR